MLAPHRAKDAQLDMVWYATQQPNDAVIFRADQSHAAQIRIAIRRVGADEIDSHRGRCSSWGENALTLQYITAG